MIAFASLAEETSAPSDDDDGAGNFLILPIIITEPAIGEGLGAGLVYFHDTPESKPRLGSARSLAKTGRRQKPPPTATGAFGFYTNNDTYAIGLGHAQTFKNDTWRMTATLADARINAKFYLADIPFGFTLEGEYIFADLKRRIADSSWFLGFSTSYADADARFRNLAAGIPDFDFTDIGVAAMAMYDTRDNSMMPSSGQLVDLTVWKYDEAIGGDFNYWTSRFKAISFHEFGERFVLGLRFQVSTADGDVPFYAEPFVPLRGIPALRYTGDVAGVVEVEGRYQFATRWSVLAFAGVGFVDDFSDERATEDDIYGWGGGLRWLALKEENVWIGVDLARGPEDDAFYIQLVHPW